MQRSFTAFIAYMICQSFLSPSAVACNLAPGSSWFWTEEALVAKTENIFVGKVLRSSQNAKDGYFRDYEIEVTDQIKGTLGPKTIWLKHFAPESFRASWGQGRGRAVHTKDCNILVAFEPGKKYLVFLNAFHPKGYEAVPSKRYKMDPWYTKVMRAAR